MADQSEVAAETPHSRMAREYVPEVPQRLLTAEVKTFFGEYCKIPEEQLAQHIKTVRDKAWQTFPYVCIGQFMFLDMAIGSMPQYPGVLRSIKQGEKFLEVGCFIGQDIRKLIYDGAPPENLIGSDVEPAFFDLGYELFNDRATLKTPFMTCDMLHVEDSKLNGAMGSISIIYASAVFHLFDWDKQVAFGVNCVKLLRKQPGSMVFGRSAFRVTAEEQDDPRGDGKVFRHDEGSWRRMWEQDISQRTRTRWQVSSAIMQRDPGELAARDGRGLSLVRFACTML